MAAQYYDRALSAFTTSVGGVDVERLASEIGASAIVIALDVQGIVVDATTCRVWFKALLSTEDEAVLDGLIAAHSGVAMPLDVSPVILEPTGDSAKALVIHGRKFVADLSEDESAKTTTFDLAFAEPRDLQGISVECHDFEDGDTIRFAMVHPATGDELRVMGEGVGDGGYPIPPSGGVNVTSEGTATVPAGVPLRLTYSTVKQVGDQPRIYVQLRQWQ